MALLAAQAAQERAGQGGRVLGEVAGDPGQVSGRQPPVPGRLPGGLGVGGQEDDGGDVVLLAARLPQQGHQAPGVPGRPLLADLARPGLGRGAGVPGVHGEHDVREQGVQPAGYLLGGGRVVDGVGLEDGGQEASEPHPLVREHAPAAVEGVTPGQERARRAVPPLPPDPRLLLQGPEPGPAVPVGVGSVRGRQDQAVGGVPALGGDLPQDLGLRAVEDVVDGAGAQARVNHREGQQGVGDKSAGGGREESDHDAPLVVAGCGHGSGAGPGW